MNECLFRNAAVRRHAAAKDKLNTNIAYLAHYEGSLLDCGPNATKLTAPFHHYSDSIFKFGTRSLCDSSAYYFYDLNYYLGRRWTFDFWMNSAQYSKKLRRMFLCGTETLVNSATLVKRVAVDSDPSPRRFIFVIRINNVPVTLPVGHFPVGAWTHFAVTCDGSTVRCFYNGELVSCVNFQEMVSEKLITVLGEFDDYYLDEYRIMRNECVWITNFTPPDAPYTGKERYHHVT